MFRQLIGALVPGLGDQRSPTDDTDAPPDDGVETALFRCENCEETFISTAMDDCPRCGAAVEPVPTAADLGFDSAALSR